MRKWIRRIQPPTIDSVFAYPNFRSFHEHTGISRNRWFYYRRKWKIKMYYIPKFNYKKWEFMWYTKMYAFDHSEVRKYERKF